MPSARRTPASGPGRPPLGSAIVALPILTATEPTMRTRQPTTTAALEDQRVPVRTKLAATWTSLMFLYAYVDILNFFTPGVIQEILDGKVFEFDLSQTFSTSALTLMAVPILMVVLSMTLPARANRITNLVVGSIQVPFAAFNAVGEVGEPWMYFYVLGVALELIVLAFILRSAWTWPRRSMSSATPPACARPSPCSARSSRRARSSAACSCRGSRAPSWNSRCACSASRSCPICAEHGALPARAIVVILGRGARDAPQRPSRGELPP